METAKAPRSIVADAPVYPFTQFEQGNVLGWALWNFGPVAHDKAERASRLIEEALEAVQAAGLPVDAVYRIAERVYTRPVGQLAQELGSVELCLMALAENENIGLYPAALAEWGRIRMIPKSQLERRHAEKVAAGVAAPSPDTVDVVEARKLIADARAQAESMIADGGHGWPGAPRLLRSLSTALETAEKRAEQNNRDAQHLAGSLNDALAAKSAAQSALETEQAKVKGLASPVMSLLTLYDAGRLEMSSEEYPGEEPQGPDDPGVPAHPIHDELVWALREAVAQLRPVTTEKE